MIWKLVMSEEVSGIVPTPPALVYLLHQLRENSIGYLLYGQIPGTDLVFVDLDRKFASNLRDAAEMPDHWSVIAPHYISHRALIRGEQDPIHGTNADPEAVVLAYGEQEAEQAEDFQALCEQVSYLRQCCPSRLVYHNAQPPQPSEVHQLIMKLKAFV